MLVITSYQKQHNDISLCTTDVKKYKMKIKNKIKFFEVFFLLRNMKGKKKSGIFLETYTVGFFSTKRFNPNTVF